MNELVHSKLSLTEDDARIEATTPQGGSADESGGHDIGGGSDAAALLVH